MLDQLPVAIIGSGPVGLAAAAHLINRGETFFILEAGEQVGANILTWGHVRLFSPWRYNTDKAAKILLEKHGWKHPDLDSLPTGYDLVNEYLVPLSNVPEIKSSLHLNTKVLSIAKKDMDKMKTANRDSVPFTIYVEKEGEYKTFEARAVIDASGTWGNPNPTNSNGIMLKEEKSLQSQIFYGVPDVLGKEVVRYANKRVAVIGGGHSAINSLLELAKLKESYPETDIIWILRKQMVQDAYGGEDKDALAARGALGSQIHRMVDAKVITVETPFFIQFLKRSKKIIDIIGT